MEHKVSKIGLGGGCHWCTEAVFLSLRGVEKVEQGFISPDDNTNSFSEAIIVHYDPKIIALFHLIEIHVYTHNSTSDHSMRSKYRSAVYVFDAMNFEEVGTILEQLQSHFSEQLVTKAYHFASFKPSLPQFHNYYYANPQKPFCNTYITPKLRLLMQKFKKRVAVDKISSPHGSFLES